MTAVLICCRRSTVGIVKVWSQHSPSVPWHYLQPAEALEERIVLEKREVPQPPAAHHQQADHSRTIATAPKSLHVGAPAQAVRTSVLNPTRRR